MNLYDTHPTLEQLTGFDQGTLAQAEWSAIERHVAGCAACCQRLENVPADGLVALMRVALGKGEPGPPPELADHPRYRIRRRLGAGGMGAVFLAEHRLMERLVALKVIHGHLLARPAIVQRFRQEVKAAARLSHPNIVTAFDADQAGDVHFLVMEYVPGTTLDQIVRTQGPQPVGEACAWVRQAALGLQHAHEQGMVHRDIKPSNLIVTSGEGRGARQDKADLDPSPSCLVPRPSSLAPALKILDFGLSLLAEADSTSLTPSGMALGTPDYIAPEQALEPHRADIRADIYSLGCTLYFLLAGHVPFPEGTALQKMIAHRESAPRPMRELRTDLPAALATILDRMLSKDPGQRFQTPIEVAQALAPFVDGSTSDAWRPAGPGIADRTPVADEPPTLVARARTAYKPRWAWRATIGLAVVIAAGGLAWLGWSLFGNQNGPFEDPPSPFAPGAEIACFRNPIKPIHRIALDANCTQALIASDEGLIQLIDLIALKEVNRFTGQRGPVVSLAFSPDGKQALSGGQDADVLWWDLKKPNPLKVLSGHKSWVRGVAFCPDGRHAVSVGNDALVIHWDLAEGKIKNQWPCHDGVIGGVRVSKDGRWALTYGFDGAVGRIDLTGEDQPFLFTAHHANAASAVFDETGKLILSGGADNELRIWNVNDIKDEKRFPIHGAGIGCVALSKDARLALSGCDRTVRVFDVATGKKLFAFDGHEDAILNAAFCPDGQRIVTASRDGVIRFWRLPEREK